MSQRPGPHLTESRPESTPQARAFRNLIAEIEKLLLPHVHGRSYGQVEFSVEVSDGRFLGAKVHITKSIKVSAD